MQDSMQAKSDHAHSTTKVNWPQINYQNSIDLHR